MQNRPVVIGISSLQQKGEFNELDESLVLMEKAAMQAVEDTSNLKIINYIDEIRVPKGFWSYRDPGRWIARKNSFNPNLKTYVTKIGVLQQNLINEACIKIQNDEIKASLIVGGESRYKKIKAILENKEFIETKLEENPDFYIKADEDLYTREEVEQLGLMAVGYYSVIETALRNMMNEDIDNHAERLSEMYENFSKIAAKRVDSWLEEPIAKEVILKTSKENKMMSYPYNKFHCTSWNVNQSAAIIICSEKLADHLEIPKINRAYPLISSENNHMISLQQRPKLHESFGLSLAAEVILKEVKKNNIKLDAYDLYSCFPSAVQMFSNALHIKKDEIQTLTGSMAFAGGPLNSYVLHSSVEMIKQIRKKIIKNGLITGVSGMMTKQSFCIWSNNYKEDFKHVDVTKEAATIEKALPVSTRLSGIGRIVGFTFFKENEARKLVIYIDDEYGCRGIISSHNEDHIEFFKKNDCIDKKVEFFDGKLKALIS